MFNYYFISDAQIPVATASGETYGSAWLSILHRTLQFPCYSWGLGVFTMNHSTSKYLHSNGNNPIAGSIAVSTAIKLQLEQIQHICISPMLRDRPVQLEGEISRSIPDPLTCESIETGR